MMDKVRGFVHKHKAKAKAMIASAVIACMCVVGGVSAFAAESDIPSVRTQLKTSASSISDDVVGVIGDVVPYAIAVLSASLVVTIGIGVVKKLMKKGS